LSAHDRADAARELFERAEGDLRAAETLAPDERQADHVVGLSAQQAVEKSLKAVLVGLDVEVPRTHDLTFLIGLLNESGVSTPDSLAESDRLTLWAGAWRYEESDETLDRAAAVSLAQAAVEWARAQLDSLL
jgi:HEPN domain-containing protein